MVERGQIVKVSKDKDGIVNRESRPPIAMEFLSFGLPAGTKRAAPRLNGVAAFAETKELPIDQNHPSKAVDQEPHGLFPTFLKWCAVCPGHVL